MDKGPNAEVAKKIIKITSIDFYTVQSILKRIGVKENVIIKNIQGFYKTARCQLYSIIKI